MSKICITKMGFDFSSRTTNGIREFDLKEGNVQRNSFGNLVRNLLKTPIEE